jgi:pterin-4a-carbinolamine dehydratase
VTDDCVFCGIAKGSIAAKVIHQDDRCVAFHDLNPAAPLHVLVTGHPDERDRQIKLLEAPRFGIVGKDLTIRAEVMERGGTGHAVVTVRRDGEEIGRTFEFSDFGEAMGFVARVALAAERADHHPDIDIRWNRVTLTLSTHSAGALTAKDTALAAEVDAWME